MAVAILSTMAIAIYRFVESNIIAIRVSSDVVAADARYDGLREVLESQWQQVPPNKRAFSGDAFKLNDRERDEVRWICSAGPGLMTRYAAGDYVVTLRVQSTKNNGLELGLLRKPKEDSSLTNANETWVPLIENVESLKIRYFDSRLNQWTDRWQEADAALPWLVKIIIGRSDAAVPWEVVIPILRIPSG